MSYSQIYTVARTYSEIIGFQEGAVDSFSIMRDEKSIIAKYRRKNDTVDENESVRITGIRFEECMKIIQLMSENAVRGGVWIEIMRDYCAERSAELLIV